MTQNQQIPQYIEQGFRWIRETIALIYAHHRHPLPMVALIFMYAETLGKPLVASEKDQTTKAKVCAFIKDYLPKLWAAFEWNKEREKILGDYYRNGLVHQMFMKNAGIHEDKLGDTQYVSQNINDIPYSINIDRLVPEFLEGISIYYRKLETDNEFLKTFDTELRKAPDKGSSRRGTAEVHS